MKGSLCDDTNYDLYFMSTAVMVSVPICITNHTEDLRT